MTKQHLFLICLMLVLLPIKSSANQDLQYNKYISIDSLSNTVHLLSDDSLQGRETGTKGQKMAASFFEKKLKVFGLNPLTGRKDFVQHHPLSLRMNAGYNIEVHQRFFLFLEEYFYTEGYRDTILFLQDITFAGYGFSDSVQDDFQNIEIAGKALMIYEEEMPEKKFKKQKQETQESILTADAIVKKMNVIFSKKPSVVFVVTKNIVALSDSLLNEENRQWFYNGVKMAIQVPVVYISEEMALNFFPEHEQYRFIKAKKQLEKKGRTISFTVKCDASIPVTSDPHQFTGENIIGMIEGTNKKEEYVFITAHYDHLGVKDGETYSGADDNASGTAAILELARVFSLAAKEGAGLTRSLVFIFMSGEEKGLLGSSFFVEKSPVPFKHIVANLNTDMIGRTDTYHDSLGIKEYVYVIGADKLSAELHRINESSNSKFSNLLLNYRYNLPDEPNQYYYRSDHYNFAKNNIPVIFYFNGVHADYHKPSDTADKIDFSLLSKRASLVFLTAWELAKRDKRILVD